MGKTLEGFTLKENFRNILANFRNLLHVEIFGAMKLVFWKNVGNLLIYVKKQKYVVGKL